MEKAYIITHNSKVSESLHSHIDMYYFGDAECEFNFISMLHNKTLLSSVLTSGKPITLLTPHITEKLLKVFQIFCENNKGIFTENINEIVVNDYGTLFFIQKSEIFKGVKIIFGNYLFSQRRDPLFKYVEAKEKDLRVSIDHSKYNDFFKKNNIEKVELYNSFQGFTIKHLKQKIHMYYPFVVHTMGRYCHRSLLASGDSTLRVVDVCTGCKGKEKYSFEHIIRNDQKIFNYGNKSFHPNYSRRNFKEVDRIIYNFDFLKS